MFNFSPLGVIAEYWGLLWHYGLTGVLMAACVAWAIFGPVFKKTALWLALLLFVMMASFTTGVHTENVRWQSKIEREAANAVSKSTADREAAVEDFRHSITPSAPGGPVGPKRRSLRNSRYNDGFARD